MRRSIVTFVLFQILIEIASIQAGFAQDASQICPDSPRTISVLVGPFTVSGTPRSYFDQEIGNVISYSLVGWLSAIPELSVIPWKSGGRGFDSRQLTDLSDLLDLSIQYEATPDRTDKDGFRRVSAIASALKAQSCDYLFGGTVNFDNSAITVSTYLMNTDPLTLSRRTGRFFYDRSASIAQLTASISKRLVNELTPKFIAQRRFEIGCFRGLSSNTN